MCPMWRTIPGILDFAASVLQEARMHFVSMPASSVTCDVAAISLEGVGVGVVGAGCSDDISSMQIGHCRCP